MQKVLELLEKHVQWVAIALGGLFVLFMVWSYVLTPVASVELGGRTLTVGEIDQATVDGPVARLRSQMNSPARIALPSVDFVGPWQASITTSPQLPRPATVVTTLPGDRTGIATGGSTSTTTTVAQLPTDPMPAPKLLGVNSGLSTITRQMPVAQPNLAGLPNQEAQFVMTPTQTDTDWVTVAYSVPTSEIAAAFTQANLPAGLATKVVYVELVREELMPDGKTWGNKSIVGSLSTTERPPFPSVKEEVPQEVRLTQQIDYQEWLQRNPIEPVQPRFYEVSGGQPWLPPLPGLEMAAPGQEFRPEDYIDPSANLSDLTEDQRRQVMDARRAAAAERRRQNTGAPGTGTGITRPPVEEGPPAGRRTRRNESFSVPSYQVPRPPMGQGGPFGGPGGWVPPEQYEGGQFNPQFNQPNLGNIPPAPTDAFIPSVQPDFVGWAVDVDVTPGTYRYRVRYHLINPVYGRPFIVDPNKPELAAQFTLVSAESEPSEPVTIPSRTQFFVANQIGATASVARFDIFRWAAGQMRQLSVSVAPGDEVAGRDGETRFETGYTVVDIRPGSTSERGYVILVDDDGRVIRKTFDRSDKTWLDLQEQMKQQLPATPAAAAQ